ncbi:MAG: phosphate/phosphite/phosphonate ABC transporter substrate-binding protein [Desulfoarculaceae bacterium]|nr:phosphate/phosphite/phosphonate ABC transporter substrate-binding protein [Desulfoarculaceae bacterium]
MIMHCLVKRTLWAVITLVTLCPSLLPASSQDESLVFGVFPYLSANQMMEQLSPLCKRIEEALGRKVILVSAPNFLSYVERTARGEYDLVLTAAHMGHLAEKLNGWQRIVQSGQKTATVLLVRTESSIRRLEDLRGKKMAVGNRLSITYLLAEKALAEAGIIMGQDMEVIETATFSNVVQSVFLGEADVGATPTLLWDNWENVNAEQHQQLREIFRAQPATPSFLVMASPRTDQATIRSLIDSLLSFAEVLEGKIFFQKSQFESFQPLDDATIESAAPFVHVLVQP